MKTKIYIIMAALLTTTLVSAQKLWTLQQCVDTALVNNRNVKQQALTKKTREIAYEQARKNLLPNLTADVSQGVGFGRALVDQYTYANQTSFST
jgi:outer membrane protein